MRPNPNLSLRLPPFTKEELHAIVEALKDEGVELRQDDLVATLITRACECVGDTKALDKLAGEIRAYRKKARPLGF